MIIIRDAWILFPFDQTQIVSLIQKLPNMKNSHKVRFIFLGVHKISLYLKASLSSSNITKLHFKVDMELGMMRLHSGIWYEVSKNALNLERVPSSQQDKGYNSSTGWVT